MAPWPIRASRIGAGRPGLNGLGPEFHRARVGRAPDRRAANRRVVVDRIGRLRELARVARRRLARGRRLMLDAAPRVYPPGFRPLDDQPHTLGAHGLGEADHAPHGGLADCGRDSFGGPGHGHHAGALTPKAWHDHNAVAGSVSARRSWNHVPDPLGISTLSSLRGFTPAARLLAKMQTLTSVCGIPLALR